MDVYLIDNRSITGRNASYGQIVARLEQQMRSGGADAPLLCRIDAENSLAMTLLEMSEQISAKGQANVLRIVGHGFPGRVLLGSDGLWLGTVRLFSLIAAKVKKIELHCCNLLSTLPQTLRLEAGINTGGHEEPDNNSGSFLANRERDRLFASQLGRAAGLSPEMMGDIQRNAGVQLVRELASASRAKVVAAIRLQTLNLYRWDFEGPTIETTDYDRLVLRVPQHDTMFGNLRPGAYEFTTATGCRDRPARLLPAAGMLRF